jgi:hypothetical protein
VRAVRRVLASLVLLLLAAYAGFAIRTRAHRAAAVPPAPGEARGAWHVHTTRSDGRGTLDEVVAAARDAGLQFVVVTDHDRLVPAEQGYRDGVLVVEGTESSTVLGHLVVLGLGRPLDQGQLSRDPLEAVQAFGGQAVVAHPLHPARPYRGSDSGAPRWRGWEVFSNDTSWHQALHERALGRILRAALELPWDGGRAVLDLSVPPEAELARFDAGLAAARRAGEVRPAPRALLCSVDAHGFPSYRAAFASVSMHLPVRLTGDGQADARAVAAALLDGSAVCVMDARGGLSRARLQGGPDPQLVLETAEVVRDATVRLVREGRMVAAGPLPLRPGENRLSLRSLCMGACAPGDYRVELWRGGEPWGFTNVVGIE